LCQGYYVISYQSCAVRGVTEKKRKKFSKDITVAFTDNEKQYDNIDRQVKLRL
jgi:hypothetical protein